MPGGQLLHAEAGVGPVLGRQGVQGPGPQGPHVGRRRRTQLVQERGEGTAAAALEREENEKERLTDVVHSTMFATPNVWTFKKQ